VAVHIAPPYGAFANPEDLAMALSEVEAAVVEIVAVLSSAVQRAPGDAPIVVFGWPVAKEDAVLRRLRAADAKRLATVARAGEALVAEEARALADGTLASAELT
jgi:class 3 adenylate cyclase